MFIHIYYIHGKVDKFVFEYIGIQNDRKYFGRDVDTFYNLDLRPSLISICDLIPLQSDSYSYTRISLHFICIL